MDGERKHFERSQKTKGEKVKAMEYAKEKDPFVMPRQKEERPARSSLKEDILGWLGERIYCSSFLRPRAFWFCGETHLWCPPT